MAIHITNPETDALLRKLASLKKTGLTDTVHVALQHELEREEGKPCLVEISRAFARDLRAMGNPALALPVDKDLIDSLYEED
ncbi:type II toxin-antitoxin system VapB family antitoxin [Aquibium sp. LZ166]|uniref:Type II toxin-antitoxin system VapB family antitoxin n=1 Tax=Aquibium pacificus TaxID=3153579 RepID=A0ABV3SKD9_9HYPH